MRRRGEGSEDHSTRGADRTLCRTRGWREEERDKYWFIDVLYPPVGKIDKSVAMETNEGMSHG